MERDLKSIQERVQRLEQRTTPPRYPSLDQVNDLLAAARIYRNKYGSTAQYAEELRRLVRHLPREGRNEIKFLAQLVEETKDLSPQEPIGEPSN